MIQQDFMPLRIAPVGFTETISLCFERHICLLIKIGFVKQIDKNWMINMFSNGQIHLLPFSIKCRPRHQVHLYFFLKPHLTMFSPRNPKRKKGRECYNLIEGAAVRNEKSKIKEGVNAQPTIIFEFIRLFAFLWLL